MVAAAGFCLMMTNTLFVVSNKLTSAANAIVLQYMAPIFVLIWDCIYRKQAPKKQQLLIVGMAFCGMVLFFFDRLGGGHLLGNLLAIVSGLCFSGVFFINSLPGSCSEDASMLGFLLSVVISVPFLGTVAGMDGTAYAALAALGIFQVGLAYVLFSEGSRRMNPVGASLIGMLEAVLNPLWVLLFYGEKMGGFALLGGTVILTAVAFGTLQTEQKG